MADTSTKALTSLPGISSAIERVNREMRSLADDDAPVIITGEHGTEKAFAAKIVHLLSTRRGGPLARINVSYSVPQDAAERFRACDGGSVILNIQRDLSDELQYLLLEIANEGAFSDPATGATVEADARLLITTGLDLDALSAQGTLLPELNDLVQNRRIHVPPVRERPEDIPALVRYAIERAYDTGRTAARAADTQVLTLFRQLKWQGNAEDLLLVTAEAAINSPGEFIGIDHLSEAFLAEVPHEILSAAREVEIPQAPPPSMVMNRDERARLAAPPRARPAVEPDPPTDPQPQAEPEAIADADTSPPVEASAPADEVATVTEDSADSEIQEQLTSEVEKRQLKRLMVLSRRLRMQSKLLARQLHGPLAAGPPPEEPAPFAEEEMGDVVEAVEAELDQGLDSVLALRRLIAQLNHREQETLLTARDLYRRLVLAGRDENAADFNFDDQTEELTGHLRQLDAIIERISGRIPGVQHDSPSTVADNLRAEEKNLITDALLRARRRAQEEINENSSRGPLTKFLRKPDVKPEPEPEASKPEPRPAPPSVPLPPIKPAQAAPSQEPKEEQTTEIDPAEIRRLQAKAMADRDEETQEFKRPDSGQIRQP